SRPSTSPTSPSCTDRFRHGTMAIMPKPPLPEPVRNFLARPLPATMATVRADGQPISVATWYVLVGSGDDAYIAVNLDATRARLKHMRANPQVSLTMLDPDDWGTHVSVLGTIVELSDDPDLVGIDRQAQHYIGMAYPLRDQQRVEVKIRID